MNPFQLLLLAFIVVPVAEIYVLITVGGIIGVGATVAAVLGTAFLGAALMRSQGLATLNRLQSEINNGQAPAQTIIEGAMILFAGALILTPGFVTDAIGFVCLTPLFRAAFARRMVSGALVNVMGGIGRRPGGPGAGSFSPGDVGARPRPGSGVIDGEFSRDDAGQSPDSSRRLDP